MPVRLRLAGRVFLAVTMLTVVAILSATPSTPAGATTGWTSHGCHPTGQTCSFPRYLGSQVTLSAVSCPTVDHCVAVGSYIDSESSDQPPCPVSMAYPNVDQATCSLPLIETLSNGVWKAATPPYPKPYPAAKGSAYLTGTLSGVSCTSNTSCVAVGSETPQTSANGFDRYTFVEVLSDGAWTPVGPFPYPHCLSTTGKPFCAGSGGILVTMHGISCTSATTCVAVGEDKVKAKESSSGKGVFQGVAYTLTGSPSAAGNWKPSYDLTATPQYNVTVAAVSCTASTTCVAVGSTTVQTFEGTTPVYSVRPLAESLSDGSWADISPSDPSVASSATLAGVSCVSNRSCDAVGSYAGSTGQGTRTGALAESLSGTSWTPTTDLETTADGASSAGLTAVSCTGVAACEAVGQYVDTSYREHALVETLSGSGWASTTGLDPAEDSSPALTDVSCPAAGNCDAVGNATTATGSLAPFVSAQESPAATSLVVSVPGSVTSGKPFAITVTAQSCINGLCTMATGYDGTIHFTSTDTAATLPPDSMLTNGGGTCTVSLSTGRSPTTATITATDTVNPAITGTSRSIRINPAKGVPAPPQFLHATGSAEQITLTWYPPAANGLLPITGYLIRRGTTPGGEDAVPIASISTSTASYVDRPAVAGVRYYYVVEAVNADGSSPPSTEASAIVSGTLGGARRFASDPSGHGYWMTSMNGAVFPFGNAGFYGSPGPLHQPYVSMASTSDGRGYWVVAADGTVYAFGDASYYGSAGNVAAARPIVGMAATRDGGGYWLVAANGTVYAFGDAPYYGSAGNVAAAQPIVGMAATPNSDGYWLVSAGGQVFVFGAAGFYGSTENVPLIEPICGVAKTADGQGYWLVGVNGAIFPFGDARYYGGLADQLIMWPIAGMLANNSGTGYQIIDWVGNPTGFGS